MSNHLRRVVALFVYLCLPSLASAEWVRHEIVSKTASMANSALANDFDNDGVMDVITSYGGSVVVLQGPHWKAFPVYQIVEGKSRTKPRQGCMHSCLLDVDGDGDLDFCGSNNTVFWLECPPEPLSGKPWVYRTIDDEILGTHCLITGDVDRDGRLDLIANSGRPQAHTRFYDSITWQQIPDSPKHASTKSWTRHVFADHDAPGASHYTGFADVNGDGRGDICCAAKGGADFPGGEWFAWWEQPLDPKQKWTKHLLSDQQPGASNIHPVDLDKDGHMDFAATRGHGTGVLWFRGPDFRIIEIDANLPGPHCLATADLDNDGDIDLATCGKEIDGIAVWYENDGNAGFSRHVIDRGQGSYDIRAIDMDGDHDLDLLIAGHSSNNVVWYENRLNAASLRDPQ